VESRIDKLESRGYPLPVLEDCELLPPFGNIRCFSFVK
jgi:hypothetical protein